jgi:D-alanyl-D-alanine carboxypeptidase (penicillin-binding protein 5/6)
MDVNTGTVLYFKNMFVKRSPASLTKMTAAIVLIEDGKLSDTVTAPAAVKGIPESSLHLVPGETISLKDLLYAMLLRSANDTPVAGAYYLSGSIPAFVKLMNAKAREIGCLHTHFVTPNGLYADEHYSCAYDLALIARYGLTHVPIFRQIVRTREYRVTRSVHKGDSVVTNTAMTFLKYFPGADGVKTGYISQAGHCFVGSATRKGWQLIAVSLNSPQCRSDVVQMLSFGFAHYRPRRIFRSGTGAGTVQLAGRSEPVVLGENVFDVIEKSEADFPISSYNLKAEALPLPSTSAVSVGDKVGTVTLYRSASPIMTVDALATLSLPAAPGMSQVRGGHSKSVLHILITVAVIVILLPFLYVFIRILDLAIHARKIAKDSRLRRSSFTEDI